MNPWLIWYAFARPEERQAMNEVMASATRDLKTLWVIPVGLALVVGYALIA